MPLETLLVREGFKTGTSQKTCLCNIGFTACGLWVGNRSSNFPGVSYHKPYAL